MLNDSEHPKQSDKLIQNEKQKDNKYLPNTNVIKGLVETLIEDEPEQSLSSDLREEERRRKRKKIHH